MQLLIKFIIIWFVWATAAAHILSWIGCFTRTGMLAALLPFAALFWRCVLRDWNSRTAKIRFFRARHRLSRGLPLAFFILSILLFVGMFVGIVPKQCDYLEYRLARMMLWIANGGIGWLPNWDSRLNFSGTAQECAVLPSILIFRTDFLAQALSFLMFLTLPSLTFKVLRGFGVPIRISRLLMWALPPSVATVVAQTGGGGNDLPSLWFGTLLLAQCLELASYAKCGQLRSGVAGVPKPYSWNPLLFAAAAAVFTNIKTSNCFLLLAFGLFILRLLVLRRVNLRVASTVGATIVFAMCSALPLLVRNYQNTSSLTGFTLKADVDDACVMFGASLISIVDSAVQPPVFPEGEQIGVKLSKIPLISKFKNKKNEGPVSFFLMQTEETAGTGIAYGVFFALFVIACLSPIKSSKKRRQRFNRFDAAMYFCITTIGFGGVAVWQICTTDISANCADRFMAVYWYVILLSLAALAARKLTPRMYSALKVGCVFSFLCAFTIVVVIPNRMLIPDSVFAKVSGMVSKSLEERSIKTSFAYRNHGREFMGLTPPDLSGRLAFISQRKTGTSVYNSYWRTGDSILLTDWNKVETVWHMGAAIFEEKQIILTSRDLVVLGFNDIEEICAAHGFSVVSQKEAIFHRANGVFTIWYLVKEREIVRTDDSDTTSR